MSPLTYRSQEAWATYCSKSTPNTAEIYTNLHREIRHEHKSSPNMAQQNLLQGLLYGGWPTIVSPPWPNYHHLLHSPPPPLPCSLPNHSILPSPPAAGAYLLGFGDATVLELSPVPASHAKLANHSAPTRQLAATTPPPLTVLPWWPPPLQVGNLHDHPSRPCNKTTLPQTPKP